MKCPRCGEENTANWPLIVGGELKDGGCQTCWEAECDKIWWETWKKAVAFAEGEEVQKKNEAVKHCSDCRFWDGVENDFCFGKCFVEPKSIVRQGSSPACRHFIDKDDNAQ